MAVAKKKKQSNPYAIVMGDVKNPDQAFLVVDGQASELKYISIIILAVWFVIICYIKGCNN